MLRHVVLLRLEDDAGPERAAEIAAELEALREIPVVQHLTVHRDAGLSSRTHDLILTADFAGPAELKAYLGHPVHRRVAGEVLGPLLERAAMIQYELEEETP
jgi:hypothetical protein